MSCTCHAHSLNVGVFLFFFLQLRSDVSRCADDEGKGRNASHWQEDIKRRKAVGISSEFGTCTSLLELKADGKRHHFCLTMLHIKKGHISSASFFCDATRWGVSWSPLPPPPRRSATSQKNELNSTGVEA